MSAQADSIARPTPASRLEGLRPYSAGTQRFAIDLRLDANEGAPDGRLLGALGGVDAETLRRYSDAGALGEKIAERWGVGPERVVVTAGGDDAIDRLLRATLEPGRSMVMHDPTFVMIPIGAALAQGEVRRVAWTDGAFPTDAYIDAIDGTTALVAIVTPNNPTGCVVPMDAVRAIVDRASEVGAVVMVDLAYAEFADEDPTRELLGHEHVAVVRTFSKARGLAGLRVGYALCSETVAGWLRTVGSPYPVSTLSLALASASLDDDGAVDTHVRAVREERGRLASLLDDLGARTLPTGANYVSARFADAGFVRDALASQGVSVRGFAPNPAIEDLLRITLPGGAAAFDRLERALRVAMAPEALLLDLDGVLADVSASYRGAIVATGRSYGVDITGGDIAAAKRAGDANNDWALTRRLLRERGVDAPLEEVTERFQAVYLGTGGSPGLRERETLIVDRPALETLSALTRLAIVTGRPRDEAEWFLERAGVLDLFETLVCMEDAPAKPSPEPVRRAMERLGVTRVWMVGDTPDDIASVRSAGGIGIGVEAPGERDGSARGAMLDAGAACVLDGFDGLTGLLA
ncbi:MAG: TIGR01548 family HAD-type hydrolase [Planctomycetota bacterium]